MNAPTLPLLYDRVARVRVLRNGKIGSAHAFFRAGHPDFVVLRERDGRLTVSSRLMCRWNEAGVAMVGLIASWWHHGKDRPCMLGTCELPAGWYDLCVNNPDGDQRELEMVKA